MKIKQRCRPTVHCILLDNVLYLPTSAKKKTQFAQLRADRGQNSSFFSQSLGTTRQYCFKHKLSDSAKLFNTNLTQCHTC